jgi:hypothetical protein
MIYGEHQSSQEKAPEQKKKIHTGDASSVFRTRDAISGAASSKIRKSARKSPFPAFVNCWRPLEIQPHLRSRFDRKKCPKMRKIEMSRRPTVAPSLERRAN